MHRARSKSPLIAVCSVAISGVFFAPHAVARSAMSSWVTATSPSTPAVSSSSLLEDRVYSLPELLSVALTINPRTRGAEEEAHQADLATQLVKSQYAPQISIKALGGIQRTPLAIPPNVSPKGYFVSNTREILPTLELKWLLLDFGRRKGQVEEARQNARAAQSGALGAQEKLIFDVSEAYFEAASAQGRVRAARKSLDAAKLTEAAVSEQHTHGRANVVQVAEAQRQTAAMRLALTKATGAADTTFASLVATIGLPPETRFEVAAPTDASTATPLLRPLNELIREALQTRPDVLGATAKVAASDARVDTARAAYRPTISLSAQVFQNIGEISSDGSPYSSINRTGNALFVAFEWPLSDGGARSTHVALALSQKARAEDTLAETKDAASRQVIEAYNHLKTSIDNRDQAIAYAHAAEVAYQASLDSYRHGLGSLTDLTDSEAALAQADADREDANASMQIAQAALALATGQPPTTL